MLLFCITLQNACYASVKLLVRLKKKMRRIVPNKNFKTDSEKDFIIKQRAKLKKIKHKRDAVTIESKRSNRVEFYGPCTFCGVEVVPLWKYKKSNIGSVYLCEKCKNIARDEEKNKDLSRDEIREKISKDFFKNNIVLVGQVESNRKKH